jgi:hypothetical protein
MLLGNSYGENRERATDSGADNELGSDEHDEDDDEHLGDSPLEDDAEHVDVDDDDEHSAHEEADPDDDEKYVAQTMRTMSI